MFYSNLYFSNSYLVFSRVTLAFSFSMAELLPLPISGAIRTIHSQDSARRNLHRVINRQSNGDWISLRIHRYLSVLVEVNYVKVYVLIHMYVFERVLLWCDKIKWLYNAFKITLHQVYWMRCNNLYRYSLTIKSRHVTKCIYFFIAMVIPILKQ